MTDLITIGDATLYHGDCLDVMSSFPECLRVDAVIWDPPWGIGFTEYESHKDCSKEYPDFIRAATDQAEKFIEDGWICVFQGARRAWEWYGLIQRPWRIMACCKNFTQILPGIGPQWSTDFCLFWPIGAPKNERGKNRDWHLAITSNMRTRPKGHPCPRPLDQMEFVVDTFSDHGMTVLDPTMGSGTTGVACANLGRKFIGIEIERKYFDIACERIEAAYAQGRLFA